MAQQWSTNNLGAWQGRRVIVTGANSGIGFHTALELGRAGADVVVACRDAGRGSVALKEMQQQVPQGVFTLELLDLASLASVRAFAERFLARGQALDLLVNNAGVMAIPTREVTVDGFERQFGTNHLGHFALTGLLLPALKRSTAPRVVTVSSSVSNWAKIDFDNLQSERRYAPMGTYGQSKLANLLFTAELGRRAPWLVSVAAHPGGSETNLQKYAFKFAMRLFGQSAAMGALPSLRAAADAVPSGTYFGPKDLFQMRGLPVVVRAPKRAHDVEAARALWSASEALTHVTFDFEKGRAAA